MHNNPLPRLDSTAAEAQSLRAHLRTLCRLAPGEVWVDPVGRHRVGCLDAANADHVASLMAGACADLAIHDPPYNLIAFEERSITEFIAWCERWICHSDQVLKSHAALYIWLGADQDAGFQPLPEFMMMMRGFENFKSRSFITMRNQRGYGTQHNYMAVRQEPLYYTKGKPFFAVQYTDIPKILRGYYKKVGGQETENLQRSHSENIRPGNVWVDIQQVFYRMQENVTGCYAQKPLKAIERIIAASSNENDLIIDFFAHAGTTLIASEKMQRQCYTCDIDPIFCEIAIRRLEHFRKTGLPGWQNDDPFAQ